MSVDDVPIFKKALITIKGQRITQADYRGLLALVLVISFIYSAVASNIQAIASLGPLTGAAVGYYFHARTNES
ncbi:MAG: hypothetical protein ACYCQJ_02585 [Nitrososphaerales archaeon]